MFKQICRTFSVAQKSCQSATFVMSKLLRVDFEIFGHVQGVSFRMYTEKEAKSLGVRGWCMNTSTNTVRGQLEAPADVMAKMKTWLEKTGSPSSRIDKAVFGVPKEIDDYTFPNFTIRDN